jgi:hypothetical protein
MALIVNDNRKVFELPPSGQYTGVLADTADLGIKKTQFGDKMKVRFVWVLGKIDGSGYALDSEGNPFRAMSEMSQTTNEKSDLYKAIRGILGTPPPVGPYDVEQLIGKCNSLFIVQEPSKDGTKMYANVKGVLPFPANVAPLAIPPSFVRLKDKKDNRAPANFGQLSTPASPQGQAMLAAGIQGQAHTGAPQQPDVVLDKSF